MAYQWAVVVSGSPPTKSKGLLIKFGSCDFFPCLLKAATAQVSKKTPLRLISDLFGLLCHKTVERREKKIFQNSVNLIQMAELLSCYMKQTNGQTPPKKVIGRKERGRDTNVNKIYFPMVTSWGPWGPAHAFLSLGHQVWGTESISSCPPPVCLSVQAASHCQATNDPAWLESWAVLCSVDKLVENSSNLMQCFLFWFRTE